MNSKVSIITIMTVAVLAGCNRNDGPETPSPVPDKQIEVETLSGGVLGTTFNSSASAFEDPSPATVQAGLENHFKYGEYFFERPFIQGGSNFSGLGPVYVRSSCIDCHPGYGYGRRMERYRASDYGNGYLLVVYRKSTNAYESTVAGMPQTRAVAPFKAPIDESGITIEWREYTDEWGNEFPDGEKYSLIYPEVNIEKEAFYVEPSDYSDLVFRLEATIGLYGVGLLDAIPDDSLKVQYQREAAHGVELNPAVWNGDDWAAYYSNGKQGDGTKYAKRFTYALSRGPLLDAAGANAIWNITNVTRSDRTYHYLDLAGVNYATKSSKDPEVQEKFYELFPEWNKTGDVEKDIYNYLTNANLPAEMSDEDYINFMVWHRGLAVPAARNLDDPQIQKGRGIFREIGCAQCHRPSWTTGDDEYDDPSNFFAKGGSHKGSNVVLPKYPHQTIWPYTDMVQHRLAMVNDIRTGWCRTTPLWGRGLSLICAGHQDRLHDRRARNVNEAIMWHGAAESDARWAVEKYRKLSKEDRDAVIAFINAI